MMSNLRAAVRHLFERRTRAPSGRERSGKEREMAQFMLLVRGGGAMPQDYTPEQVQQALQMYFDWSEKLRGEGRLRGGDQLSGGRTVRMQGGQAVVDGPYAETKEAIGGYFLIDAASTDEAAEVAKGCPVLCHGGLVDVREIVAM
jgi:hypothetical protein